MSALRALFSLFLFSNLQSCYFVFTSRLDCVKRNFFQKKKSVYRGIGISWLGFGCCMSYLAFLTLFCNLVGLHSSKQQSGNLVIARRLVSSLLVAARSADDKQQMCVWLTLHNYSVFTAHAQLNAWLLLEIMSQRDVFLFCSSALWRIKGLNRGKGVRKARGSGGPTGLCVSASAGRGDGRALAHLLGLLKNATSPGSSPQKGYIQDVSAGPASGE